MDLIGGDVHIKEAGVQVGGYRGIYWEIWTEWCSSPRRLMIAVLKRECYCFAVAGGILIDIRLSYKTLLKYTASVTVLSLVRKRRWTNAGMPERSSEQIFRRCFQCL